MRKFLVFALMMVMAISFVGGAQAAADPNRKVAADQNQKVTPDPNQQATAAAEAAQDMAVVVAARACFGKLQTAMTQVKPVSSLKPGESSTVDIPGCYTLTNSVTEDNGGLEAFKIGPNMRPYCKTPEGVSELSVPLPRGKKFTFWRIRTRMYTCWNGDTSNIDSFAEPTVATYSIFPWSVTNDAHHSQWMTQPILALGTSTSTVVERVKDYEIGRVSWTHNLNIQVCGTWSFTSETADE